MHVIDGRWVVAVKDTCPRHGQEVAVRSNAECHLRSHVIKMPDDTIQPESPLVGVVDRAELSRSVAVRMELHNLVVLCCVSNAAVSDNLSRYNDPIATRL